ncbi:hypothetical protein DAETH_39030 (plasmid) [Deinococcus aetherius]|uniref:Uncharacterized protein n=1 Tax=Deinococcus aetherius TaxID=200252 RepID=A0ABM8AJG0_9DEIO|nr:hypothetical protein [Deinococcus aetherius]BDP43934.1 hypothetical protein DAETH_39030 [Deinococcus aetherius]
MRVARDHPGRVARLVLWLPSGGLDFGEDAFSPLARAVLSTLARVPGLNLIFYRLVFHRHSFIRPWFTSQGFLNPAGRTRLCPSSVDRCATTSPRCCAT